jgi:hypothetical protein
VCIEQIGFDITAAWPVIKTFFVGFQTTAIKCNTIVKTVVVGWKFYVNGCSAGAVKGVMLIAESLKGRGLLRRKWVNAKRDQ